MAIRVLDDNLINQISAGEVIERPASVVKELVENAIDAGATKIDIDIVDGGRTLICVSDNGSGMSKEDLLKSVSRHATSKIKGNDLLNITTMGFRGEALPSIASVSDMEIKTCHNSESWSLDISNSENPVLKPDNIPLGTKIFVKNLFAKTPARLKFLRSDRAETSAIIDWVKTLSLSKPEISFNLNKKWIYQKADKKGRIFDVLGNDFSDNMLYLDESDSDIKLSGFISKPTYRRATSDSQFLFVNGRAVKDKILIGALRAGYFDVMAPREYPSCVLYLEMPTDLVDINVHPAKIEVHFLYPVRVRSLLVSSIRHAISKTLENTINENTQHIIPSQSITENIPFKNYIIREPSSNYNYNNSRNFESMPVFSDMVKNINENKQTECEDYHRPLGRPLAQIMNAYILSESEYGFIITDQHAAHERIVYEKLRKNRENNKIITQPLLVPEIIELGDLSEFILDNSGLFSVYGILLEPFGDGAIIIREVPAGLDLDWKNLITEMAEQIKEDQPETILSEKLHKKIATYACHHSVRAGQKLDLIQMNELLRQIEETERGGQCNHGRPVYKIFKKSDLDKIFERI